MVAFDTKSSDRLAFHIEWVFRFDIRQPLPKSKDIRLESWIAAQGVDHLIGIVQIFVPIILEADQGNRASSAEGKRLPTNLNIFQFGRRSINNGRLGNKFQFL